MKVLAITNPGLGHLLPMLPTIHALQRRGHHVRVATARAFVPTVEAYGVSGVPAGLDWLETQAVAVFPELDAMAPDEQGSYFLEGIFADVAAHQMVSDLVAICAEWQPDVLLRNDFEFGSCVAAELVGCPHATIGVSYFLSAATLEPMVGEQLAYLRSAYGLAPYPACDMLYPYLYLTPAPPTFQPRELPVMHHMQPAPVGGDDTTGLDWLNTLPPQPTIYASMSSVYRGADLFPTIISALRDEPVNLIVTTGKQREPAHYGPQPPNVHIERFVPQAALLPHCDVFITHSPFFTVMSALSYGVSLLMIPTAGELLGGALRAMELGLGRVLHVPEQAGRFDRWVQPVSQQHVRETVRELLANHRFRAHAEQMRAEIAALPTPDEAALLVEQLARERSPVRVGGALAAPVSERMYV